MVLLIYAALIFFRALFLKQRADILCCGIWGGSFKVPLQDDFLIKKLQILAMFNQERGEDSVGYFNGTDLVKDADKNKKVVDFVINLGFKKSDQQVFIGHNRKQSRGIANLENAHPFNIEDKLIFAHNGTLDNWTTLADTHGVSHQGIYNDSRIFGALLNKIGPDILEQYKGYAAIAVHKLDEPGSLYLYHGASREFSNGDVREERPLFYMKAKEGIFFSSIERSLEFIRTEGDEKPEVLLHNHLFCIRNGEFLKKKIKIARENMNVSSYNSTNSNTNFSSTYYRHRHVDYSAMVNRAVNSTIERSYGRGGSSAARTQTTNSTVGRVINIDNGQLSADRENGFDIETEFIPRVAFGPDSKNRVFYYKNRYYVEKPGESLFQQRLHGIVFIDKFGKYHESMPQDDKDNLKISVYYFYRGIMLTDKKAFETVHAATTNHQESDLGRKLTRGSMNFAKYISKYSRYPVTNLNGEASVCAIERNKFFKNEQLADRNNGGEIKPLFSDRTYTYKNGILRRIQSDDTKETNFFPQSGTSKAASGTSDILEDYEPRNGVYVKKETGGETGAAHSSNPSVSSRYDVSHLYDDEFKSIKALFHRTYDDLHQIDNIFGSSIAFCALWLYMEDLAKTKLKVTEPTYELVQKLIQEYYERLVTLDLKPTDAMEADLPGEDYYIASAFQDSRKDKRDRKVSLKEDPNFIELNNTEEEDALFKEADETEESTVSNDADFIINQLWNKAQYAQKGVQDLEASLNKIGDEIDFEEVQQEDEAVARVEEILQHIDEIETSALELGELQLSKFADKLKQNVDIWTVALRNELITLCKAFKYNELAEQIQQAMPSYSSDNH